MGILPKPQIKLIILQIILQVSLTPTLKIFPQMKWKCREVFLSRWCSSICQRGYRIQQINTRLFYYVLVMAILIWRQAGINKRNCCNHGHQLSSHTVE